MSKKHSKKSTFLNRPILSRSNSDDFREVKSNWWKSTVADIKNQISRLKNSYFNLFQITHDINREYGKIMSYKSIDKFSINLLWLHLLFTLFLILIVTGFKISNYIPSPFSWRPITYTESVTVLLIALLTALIPTILRTRLRNHYYFRISVAIALTMFSFIFIFLSGGAIEMHFHTFIVMAYMATYSDWRLGWIIAILAIVHNTTFNFFLPNWVFFYGRNDISIIAHLVPITAMAIFTSAFCSYHRNTVISLDNVRKTLMKDLREKTIIEEYLVQSETKYRQLVDFNPIGIGEADFNGDFRYVNDSFLSILGYSREDFELDQIPWNGITPEEYKPIDENAIAEMRTQGTATPFEKEFIRKDNTKVSVLIGSTILDESENTYICYILDITKEKQIQKKLKSSLHEKEALLKEIHHRVKNNLQIISSLLSLQSKRIRNKEYIDIFNDSKNRIKSMAIIHEKLYKSNNLSQIDFGDYIKSLAQYLFDSYQYDTDAVHLNIQIDKDIYLSIETAIPCGLIVNELITNALKHAFKGKLNGEITIKMSKIDDKLELIVQDNGVGIPTNIDLKNVTSLGLQLVNTLVDQIDGKLDMESNLGTLFKIQFKSYINA